MRDVPTFLPGGDNRTRENARRGVLRALWLSRCVNDGEIREMCTSGNVDPPAEYDPLGPDEPAPRPRSHQPALFS